ncbi:MAG: AAA family ATPase [Candidatus Woesearchaeota archaeon]
MIKIIIKKIKIKNIRNIEKLELDFKKGNTIIKGDNATGKTSFRLALEYTLYGSIPNYTLKNMITHGKKKMAGIVVFEHNGEECKVKRESELDKGSISSKAKLKYQGEIIEGARNVTNRIEKIVKLDQDTFNLLNPHQANICKVLQMTDTNRAKMFDSILGIGRYRDTYEDMRNVVSPIESRKSNVNGKIETLENWLDEVNIDKLNEELSNLKKNKGSFSEDIENFEEELEKVSKNLKGVEKKKKQLENVKQVKNKINDLQNKIKLILNTVNDKNKRLEDLKENLEEENEKLSNIKKEKEELEDIGKIEEKLEEKGEKINDIEKDNNYLNSKLDSIKDSIKKLDKNNTCPVCKQEIGKDYKKECQEDLYQNKKQVKNKIIKNKKQKEKLEKQKKIITEKYEKIKEKTENKIEKINNKNSKINNLKENIENLEKEIEENQKEVSKTKKEIDKIEKENDIKNINEEDIEEKYEKLRQKQKDLEIKINDKKNKKNNIEEKIKNKKEKIEEYNKKKNEKKQKEEKITEISTILKDVKNIRKMFKKLGPEIREYLKILLDKKLSELFDKVRETLDYDDVNILEDYNIQLKEGEYTRLASECSGAEKLIMSILLRLATTKVLSNSEVGNQNIDFLIIDEPEERGVDPESMKLIVEVLEKIQLNQLIIITHNQLFQERVGEHAYEFYKNENGRAQKRKIN